MSLSRTGSVVEHPARAADSRSSVSVLMVVALAINGVGFGFKVRDGPCNCNNLLPLLHGNSTNYDSGEEK
jgi:hypothetical protein